MSNSPRNSRVQTTQQFTFKAERRKEDIKPLVSKELIAFGVTIALMVAGLIAFEAI